MTKPCLIPKAAPDKRERKKSIMSEAGVFSLVEQLAGFAAKP